MLSQRVASLQATRQLALLAKEMKGLQGFVYISTAYVNAHLPSGSRIEERIYPLQAQDGSTLQHSKVAAQLAAMKPKKAEKTVLLRAYS